MKLLHQDLKHQTIKVMVENLDDLWYLSYIIDAGDSLKAKTFRKIKLGESSDRNAKVIKKEIYLTISVENVEFDKYANRLRVSGKVTEGSEDVPNGSYHTMNVEEGSVFELVKTKFLKFQLEKLDEATKEAASKILIVVHDREEAVFALLKKYGYEVILRLSGNVAKKADMDIQSGDFYADIYSKMAELDSRYAFSNIIVASPTFWKEYLLKKIEDDRIRKKIVLATCSSVGDNGLNEVIKRQEVQSVLKQERFASEMQKMERLLSEISTQGKAEYGMAEVRKVAEMGAIEELLVSDEFIQKRRMDNTFDDVDRLMKQVDSMNGEVHIVSSEHEGGKKLDGLGGIAALLRYKLSY